MMTELNENSIKNICLTIPFSSSETVALVREVLAVDQELQGSRIRRDFITSESNLLINFYGSEWKLLRVTVNAVLKNVLLIIKTIDQLS